MPYQHFLVPAQGGMVERQFQEFLRSHAILKVERRFVEREDGVFWAYSVEFDEVPERGITGSPAGPARDRERIDYKEILTETEFVTYVKLRDWRTEEAKTRKVPPFSIFTNEELAQIAQRRPASADALQEIPGIGPGKAGKYGAAVLALVGEIPPDDAQDSKEKTL
jgi:superfamily II DNA helicase RecQ